MFYDDQVRAWQEQCDALIRPLEKFLAGQPETVRHFQEWHEAALRPAREIQAAIERLAGSSGGMDTFERILAPAFRVQELVPSSVAAIQEMSRLPDWHQSLLDMQERWRRQDLERSREEFERNRAIEQSLDASAAASRKKLAREIAEAIADRLMPADEPEPEEPQPKPPIGFGNRN
jgi:hypothetical protein